MLEENLKERDLGVDGRIILKYISERYDGSVWTGFIWLTKNIGGGLL
jgi:hypothetical protein